MLTIVGDADRCTAGGRRAGRRRAAARIPIGSTCHPRSRRGDEPGCPSARLREDRLRDQPVQIDEHAELGAEQPGGHDRIRQAQRADLGRKIATARPRRRTGPAAQMSGDSSAGSRGRRRSRNGTRPQAMCARATPRGSPGSAPAARPQQQQALGAADRDHWPGRSQSRGQVLEAGDVARPVLIGHRPHSGTERRNSSSPMSAPGSRASDHLDATSRSAAARPNPVSEQTPMPRPKTTSGRSAP